MSQVKIGIVDLHRKFDVIIELVGQMRDDMKGLVTKDDLAEVKSDIKVIKAAVTDLGDKVNDHEVRITTLETA